MFLTMLRPRSARESTLGLNSRIVYAELTPVA
jgi:hypothetical protein